MKARNFNMKRYIAIEFKNRMHLTQVTIKNMYYRIKVQKMAEGMSLLYKIFLALTNLGVQIIY
jgi:hypothetical protein